jgi:hypothetical protein
MDPVKKLKLETKAEPLVVVAPSHQTTPKKRDRKAEYQRQKEKKEAEDLLINFRMKCLEECSQFFVAKCSTFESEVI